MDQFAVPVLTTRTRLYFHVNWLFKGFESYQAHMEPGEPDG